jgi:hypothetical protein
LFRVLLVLALASGFCGVLALARIRLTGRAALLFLGWNLILAWVPLLVSLVIVRRHAPGRQPSGWPSSPTPPTWSPTSDICGRPDSCCCFTTRSWCSPSR